MYPVSYNYVADQDPPGCQETSLSPEDQSVEEQESDFGDPVNPDANYGVRRVDLKERSILFVQRLMVVLVRNVVDDR